LERYQDSVILSFAKLIGGDAVLSVRFACLEKLWRSQEAADMVGSIR
jgi:hypothetical protein